jgi:two-component system, chemotaxis family, protein-glutamate methylesterase/glutaminase
VSDRLVVIGASAGGVQTLHELLGALPADLPATVLVVVHIPPVGESALPRVLARAGALPARHPRDGDPLTAGEILVAPPDRHLLVQDSRVRLRRGPWENRQRPAIDPLFRSAAAARGSGVVAVVLSGALDDGAVGAASVAAQDGLVLVQDPAEARVSSMPRAALAAVRRAQRLPAAELGPRIAELVRSPGVHLPPAAPVPQEGSASMAGAPTEASDLGTPAALGCPDCQGGMYEGTTDGTVAYRCHVGHTWAAQTLLDAQRQAVESAIYNAASKLLEIAGVHRRLADRDVDSGEREANLRAAEEAEQRAEQIRRLAGEDPP